MSLDPYSTSAYSAVPEHPSGNPSAVDSTVILMLQQTRPWVRLCSVIGFIGTGLILLGAVAMVISGVVAGSRSRGGMPFAGVTFLLGALYAVMGLLYLFPSLKLWRYGTAIANLSYSASLDDLIRALDQQRSFWKFVGIMVCVILGIYALMFVGFLLIGVGSLSSMRHI